MDQYDRPGTQTELMRPVYDGEGQNGNFYPECYIIPMDSANQKNLYDAAAEMKYLTRNDVKVNVASKEFTYDGVTYPAGTMVVSMYQAKRSLANSQLFDGTFINVWQGLYSESFAQRSNARGYDRVIVAEPAAYKTIMAACPETINYTQALTYLAAFATQFEGRGECRRHHRQRVQRLRRCRQRAAAGRQDRGHNHRGQREGQLHLFL